MIRILQVVTHMNCGGLESMIMNYYRMIDREQVQFDFLVHRRERAVYDNEIEALGGIIYRLPALNPFSGKYTNELKRFFKQHPEYKVIHVHQDCMSSVILNVAQECGVEVRIAHSHSSSQDKNLKYLLKLYYKKQIAKYATHLFACGEAAGQWMYDGKEFEILNNAINASNYRYDAQKREAMRLELGIDENCLLVGHVGRFNYPKNHTFLIDIFQEVCHKEESKLLLVGDGELRTEIEKKVLRNGLEDKVIFTGIRRDVADLLQAIDVFVFPSNYEGLPVTLIEAQASGLRCIISDKVPQDCKKTELVEQVSLQEGAGYWANRIIAAAKEVRIDTYEDIKQSGYDIQENAKRLQSFYLKAYKGEQNICLY